MGGRVRHARLNRLTYTRTHSSSCVEPKPLIMKPSIPCTCRNVASCRAGIDPCDRTDQDWCHGVGDRGRRPPSASPAQYRLPVALQRGGPDHRKYITLDDGGDTTRAVQNAKQLITQHKVDAIIGPSTTPNALAILPIIAEAKVPLVGTVGSQAVVEPQDATKRWVFKTDAERRPDCRGAGLAHGSRQGQAGRLYRLQ